MLRMRDTRDPTSDLYSVSYYMCLLQMCTRSDGSGAWDNIVRGTTHSYEVRYVWCMFVCLVFVHTTLRFFCYWAVCSGLQSVMDCLGFRHAKQDDASL